MTKTQKPKSKLQEAKEILESRGLDPMSYKHLPYEEILKLAGLES